jgi:hypothetical protein
MKKLLFVLLIILGACESQNPFPYLPYQQQYTLEVAYVKLAKSIATNSKGVIANGLNYVELEVLAFNNVDTSVPLYDSKNDIIEVQTNGKNFQLGYPFRFSTTEKGSYSFRLKPNGIPVRDANIEITAIAPVLFRPTVLPVIFHYFNHTTKPLSNSEKDSVSNYLSKLVGWTNKDFSNLSGSTDPNANDTGIQLQMATKDIQGSALTWTGVNFIETGGTSFQSTKDFEDYTWQNCFWPPKKYINVWVALAPYFDPKLNGFSWAYFPDFTQGSSAYPPGLYGVMLHQRSAFSSLLSHEIGHMLNLFHVFGDCTRDTDNCSDTWSYHRTVYDDQSKFSIEKTSCSSERFISTNLMDYGPCWNNTFTLQQALLIQETLSECSFLPTKRNGYINGRASEDAERPTKVRVADKSRLVL